MTKTVEEVNESLGRVNDALSGTLVQFDTLVQLQSEERIEMQKMYNDTLEKERTHYRKIIIFLILTIILLVGGIAGGFIYLISNYDFAVVTSQDANVGGDGNIEIHDGASSNVN